MSDIETALSEVPTGWRWCVGVHDPDGEGEVSSPLYYASLSNLQPPELDGSAKIYFVTGFGATPPLAIRDAIAKADTETAPCIWRPAPRREELRA